MKEKTHCDYKVHNKAQLARNILRILCFSTEVNVVNLATLACLLGKDLPLGRISFLESVHFNSPLNVVKMEP